MQKHLADRTQFLEDHGDPVVLQAGTGAGAGVGEEAAATIFCQALPAQNCMLSQTLAVMLPGITNLCLNI